MKKTTGALVLLFLMLSLAAVLYVRTQHAVIGATDPTDTGPEATAPAEDERGDSPKQTDRPDSEQTGVQEPESTPVPVPTPTPSPTPRPLRPVSLSDQDSLFC